MLTMTEPVDGAPVALLVPHAGYAFSGPTAAAGFAQLSQGDYEVVVVLASDHQLPLSDPISVWAEGGFETPLGVVPVDVELAQLLIETEPLITQDLSAHADEHPIEIELPFVQRVCPGCAIVPILMGTEEEDAVRALADALLTVLPGRRAVVVASSDLSHYPSREDAVQVDRMILAAIETGRPDSVRTAIDTVTSMGVSNLATCACGEGPILVAMQVATGLGADVVTILDYANSADSPYGDAAEVVGYGAVMFWHYSPPDLDQERRDEILRLARDSIYEYLETGAVSDYETGDPELARLSGVFVTLKEHGELRGCIGHIWSDLPLHEAVRRMAVAAAIDDPRFSPLTGEGLSAVSIEISVLSPFRRVTDVGEIEIGTHGLMLYTAGHQGLLLPQVPTEQGWDRDEFLDNLCFKAGLSVDCWKDGVALYSFTALVFGEDP